MSKEINRSRQFSLFPPHEASAGVKPPEKPSALCSRAAAEILKEKAQNKNKKKTARYNPDDFRLDACRACKSIRLMHIDNVYVCKACGAENTYSGVLFGTKHKKGDKL